MKPLLRNAALVLLTLAALYVLWQVRATILLFLLALGLSAALRPAVDRLDARQSTRAARRLESMRARQASLGDTMETEAQRVLTSLQDAFRQPWWRSQILWSPDDEDTLRWWRVRVEPNEHEAFVTLLDPDTRAPVGCCGVRRFHVSSIPGSTDLVRVRTVRRRSTSVAQPRIEPFPGRVRAGRGWRTLASVRQVALADR